jgi:hypothetical protein
VALGEHDANCAQGNPEQLSLTEQSELYLGSSKLHYFVDIPNKHLRLIFLDAFDESSEPALGYSQDCVDWLRCTLVDTPPARRVVVFSHMPPLGRLLPDAAILRGQDELMKVLNEQSGRILAFVNGHNHFDRLDNEGSFPIISIANAKCEAIFKDKPQDSIIPERTLDSSTQECWDVLLVNPLTDTIRFIRFGAGADRIVANGEAQWA